MLALWALDVNSGERYSRPLILSFACAETERIFAGQMSRRLPPDIQRTARRKLHYLAEAEDLRDLLPPAGNRLQALRGDRLGQHSIRINDRWRICFRWHEGNAYEVEIVDYH